MGKRKNGRPLGTTLGGIIVGFDQQVLRTTPPIQELIAKGQPVRGVSGEDGGEFEVVFPPDEASSEAAAVSTDPTASPGLEPGRSPESPGRNHRLAPPEGGP